MKTIATLILISTTAFATAAFAQSANDESMKSDVDAINHDNAAIQKSQHDMSHDSNAQSVDKANGHYGDAAADTAKMGADKATEEGNKAAKYYHKKKLQHHKKQVNQDNGDADTSVTPQNQ